MRMNRGKVRQPGTVSQRYLTVRLIRGTRHAEHTLSLTGDVGADASAVRDAVAGLRAALPELADDPLLLLPTEVRSSRNVRDASLPPSEAVIDEVLAAAADSTSSASTRRDRCGAASPIPKASATGTRPPRSTCSGASITAPTRR